VNSAPPLALSTRQPALSPRRATAHWPGHGPGTKPGVKAARAPSPLRGRGLQPSAGTWPAGRATVRSALPPAPRGTAPATAHWGSPVRVLRHRLPGREVSWSGGTPVAFIVVRSVRELIRPAAASSRVRYAW